MGSLLLWVYLQGFGGSVGEGRIISASAKGGNSSVPFPSNSGTCRKGCWVKLREGISVRKTSCTSVCLRLRLERAG